MSHLVTVYVYVSLPYGREDECLQDWRSFGVLCTDLSRDKRVVSVSC